MYLKEKFFPFLKKVFLEFGNDNSAQKAASLAFYSIFSIAPLLMVLVTGLGLVFEKVQAQKLIVDQVAPYLGDQGMVVVTNILDKTSNALKPSFLKALVSFLILFFGASTVFVELKQSMNSLYKIKQTFFQSYFRDRFYGFLIILATGAFILLSFLLTTYIAGIYKFSHTYIPYPRWMFDGINFCFLLASTIFLFALLFKFLPSRYIIWKDAFKAGLVTALLFIFGKSALSLYLSKSSISSAYGAASSFVVFIIWIYYSSQIFFIGAEVCKVLTLERENSV